MALEETTGEATPFTSTTIVLQILSIIRCLRLSKAGKRRSAMRNKPPVRKLNTYATKTRTKTMPIPGVNPVFTLVNLICCWDLPIVCPVFPCRIISFQIPAQKSQRRLATARMTPTDLRSSLNKRTTEINAPPAAGTITKRTSIM